MLILIATCSLVVEYVSVGLATSVYEFYHSDEYIKTTK